MLWLVILALGLFAGTLSSIVGFGASLIVMPLLVFGFGPKEAVPIMAIAGLMANAGRVLVWWRDVDWRVNTAYCATAIPAAALGASLLVTLDSHTVEAVVGAFLICMVPTRRWLLARGFRIGLPGLAVVGACIGFLTGMVASTGPVNTPFFLAYGLVKGAYLSTEAVGSIAISLTKAVVFRRAGALPLETILRGLIVGSALMAGAWIARQFVQRLEASQFRLIMDGLLVISGTLMLWSALTAT
jgi:uncharacterized membrane protein YfcA